MTHLAADADRRAWYANGWRAKVLRVTPGEARSDPPDLAVVWTCDHKGSAAHATQADAVACAERQIQRTPKPRTPRRPGERRTESIWSLLFGDAKGTR